MYKAYPVSSVTRSNLSAQPSQWLQIPNSEKCSLSDLSQKSLAKFLLIHEHGSGKWGLLSLYEHEQILRKPSSLKLLVRF